MTKILIKTVIFALLFAIIISSVTSIAEPNNFEINIDEISLPSTLIINNTITINDEITINDSILDINKTSDLEKNKIIIYLQKINDTIEKPPLQNNVSNNITNIDKFKDSIGETNNYLNSLPSENSKKMWEDLKNVDFIPRHEEKHQRRIEFYDDIHSRFDKYSKNILDDSNLIFNKLGNIPSVIGKIFPIKLPWESRDGGSGNVGNIEIIGATMGSVFILGYLASFGSSKYSSIFLPIPLYSRIKKEKVLEHKTRDNIYSFVLENPGASRLAIKEKLSLANGSTGHHLRTLEREGYIKSIKHGRLRQFYVSGTKVSELSEIQEKISKIVEQNPGIMQTEIATKLNVSRQAVNYQIKYLADKGIIHVVTSGRKTTCYFDEQAS